MPSKLISRFEEWGAFPLDLDTKWTMDHPAPWIILPTDGDVLVWRGEAELGTLRRGQPWGLLVPRNRASAQVRLAPAGERELRVLILSANHGFGPALGDAELLFRIHSVCYEDRETFWPPDPVLEALKFYGRGVFDLVKEWVDPGQHPVEFVCASDGEVICEQRARPRGLYLILDGVVRLSEARANWERVYAFLKPGSIFGELERPIAREVLPSMLGARVGYDGLDKASWLNGPKRSTLIHIPYETLAAVIETNPHAEIDVRLSGYTRLNFWNWWPMLRSASATTRDAMLAATLLRSAQWGWLGALRDPSWREVPPSSVYFQREYTFDVDWREVLMLATGCMPQWASSLHRLYPTVRSLLETGMVSLDISGYSTAYRWLASGQREIAAIDVVRALMEKDGDDEGGSSRGGPNARGRKLAKRKVAWRHPAPMSVTVHKVHALEAIADGRFSASVLQHAAALTQPVVTASWDVAAPYWIKRLAEGKDEFRKHVLIELVVKELGESARGHVLDAGCGEGCIARALLERGAARVTGVDTSVPLVAHASTLTADERAKFFVRDVSSVRWKAEFDAVVCNMVLMDLPEYELAIRAIARTLKEGARGVWTIINPALVKDNGTWWLDGADARDGNGTQVDILRPEFTHQCQFARYVQLDQDAPRTPYFHRKKEEYRTAFGKYGYRVIREFEAPLDETPPSFREKILADMRGYSAASPIYVFVTERSGPIGQPPVRPKKGLKPGYGRAQTS